MAFEELVATLSPEREAVLGHALYGADTETLSHFELYLRAMREVGANATAIEATLGALARGAQPSVALEMAPAPARSFVLSTFAAIASPHVEELAASFLCGREDLVPAMFRRFLAQVGEAPSFVRYLERHIEVDEGEHGPLARTLLADLCGTDPAAWYRATAAARSALVARKRLWDGVITK